MNWTQLLTSEPALALYGFVVNTVLTYTLRAVSSEGAFAKVLRAIVGAIKASK